MHKIQESRLAPELFVLPIEKGGTASVDARQGAMNLGLLTTGSKNAPLGYLQGDTKLGVDQVNGSLADPSRPLINGPTVANVSEEIELRIQNYDSFTNYLLQAFNGVAVRDEERISFTGLAAGDGYVLVNQTKYVIRVGSGYVATPVLDAQSFIVKRDLATLVSEPYLAIGDQSNTHVRTDWQIATDAGFTNIVAQSLDDDTNLTSWTAMDLQYSTDYYARVRHEGSVTGKSAWSDVTGFKTIPAFPQAKVQSISIATYNSTNGNKLSGDGKVLVIADYYSAKGTTTGGKVHLFVYDGAAWVFAQTISGGAFFGSGLALSYDGSTLLVGAASGWNDAPGGNFASFFKRTPGTNTWTLEKTVTRLTNYGYKVSLNNAGDKALVSAWGSSVVDYYERNVSGVWTLHSTIAGGDTYFGAGPCQISEDGLTAVAPYYRAYTAIFERVGTTWTRKLLTESAGGTDIVHGAMDSAGTLLFTATALGSWYSRAYKKVNGVWAMLPSGLPTNLRATSVATDSTGRLVAFGHPTNGIKIFQADENFASWTQVQTFPEGTANGSSDSIDLSKDGGTLVGWQSSARLVNLYM